MQWWIMLLNLTTKVSPLAEFMHRLLATRKTERVSRTKVYKRAERKTKAYTPWIAMANYTQNDRIITLSFIRFLALENCARDRIAEAECGRWTIFIDANDTNNLTNLQTNAFEYSRKIHFTCWKEIRRRIAHRDTRAVIFFVYFISAKKQLSFLSCRSIHAYRYPLCQVAPTFVRFHFFCLSIWCCHIFFFGALFLGPLFCLETEFVLMCIAANNVAFYSPHKSLRNRQAEVCPDRMYAPLHAFNAKWLSNTAELTCIEPISIHAAFVHRTASASHSNASRIVAKIDAIRHGGTSDDEKRHQNIEAKCTLMRTKKNVKIWKCKMPVNTKCFLQLLNEPQYAHCSLSLPRSTRSIENGNGTPKRARDATCDLRINRLRQLLGESGPFVGGTFDFPYRLQPHTPTACTWPTMCRSNNNVWTKKVLRRALAVPDEWIGTNRTDGKLLILIYTAKHTDNFSNPDSVPLCEWINNSSGSTYQFSFATKKVCVCVCLWVCERFFSASKKKFVVLAICDYG